MASSDAQQAGVVVLLPHQRMKRPLQSWSGRSNDALHPSDMAPRAGGQSHVGTRSYLPPCSCNRRAISAKPFFAAAWAGETPVLLLGVDIRAARDQQFDRCPAPPGRRLEQRSRARFAIARLAIRTLIEQQRNHLRLPAQRRIVQRRQAVAIGGIGIGAVLQQQIRDRRYCP